MKKSGTEVNKDELESSTAEAAEDRESAEEPFRWVNDTVNAAETEKNQVRLLGSIVRLYRTRSEEAIDALVDELFPHITEVEE